MNEILNALDLRVPSPKKLYSVSFLQKINLCACLATKTTNIKVGKNEKMRGYI